MCKVKKIKIESNVSSQAITTKQEVIAIREMVRMLEQMARSGLKKSHQSGWIWLFRVTDGYRRQAR